MQINSKLIFDDPNISDFTLFPYQATAVQWLRTMENNLTVRNSMKGGILADDMGFGKTKMVAALCESNYVPNTLIITPLNLMDQMVYEIKMLSNV